MQIMLTALGEAEINQLGYIKVKLYKATFYDYTVWFHCSCTKYKNELCCKMAQLSNSGRGPQPNQQPPPRLYTC